jgi:hypothetical protein
MLLDRDYDAGCLDDGARGLANSQHAAANPNTPAYFRKCPIPASSGLLGTAQVVVVHDVMRWVSSRRRRELKYGQCSDSEFDVLLSA